MVKSQMLKNRRTIFGIFFNINEYPDKSLQFSNLGKTEKPVKLYQRRKLHGEI